MECKSGCMKLLTGIGSLLFGLAGIVSCEKNDSDSIIGKWNLITDSSYVAEAPPFFNAGSGIYQGNAGDYYDFRNDGTLYIKEGAYSDTVSYKMESGRSLTITYRSFNIVEDSLGNIISKTHPQKSFDIETLTTHQLVMTTNMASDVLTPEGYFLNRYSFTR